MREFVVLLAEDDDGDAALVQLGMQRWERPCQLHRVPNGRELIAFLRHESGYESMPVPDIILLDLNMPHLSGLEALKIIREDPNLSNLIVIILTTSVSQLDIARCYQRGANSYITKPVDLDSFMSTMRTIESYWTCVAKLPS